MRGAVASSFPLAQLSLAERSQHDVAPKTVGRRTLSCSFRPASKRVIDPVKNVAYVKGAARELVCMLSAVITDGPSPPALGRTRNRVNLSTPNPEHRSSVITFLYTPTFSRAHALACSQYRRGRVLRCQRNLGRPLDDGTGTTPGSYSGISANRNSHGRSQGGLDRRRQPAREECIEDRGFITQRSTARRVEIYSIFAHGWE